MTVQFSLAQDAARVLLEDGDQRYTCLAGGTRSGKTFLIVRAIIGRAKVAAGSTHAILRLHANAAKASIMQETIPNVRRLCFPELELTEHKTDSFWSLTNGSRITVGGLDDAARVEKILGLEYSTVFLNEVSQISYDLALVAFTRLAQVVPGIRQRAYVDLNPTAKSHWTNMLFGQKRDPLSRHTFTQAVPDTAVTISAGTLLQIVEGANIPAATMWLTWTGTAAARAYQGSASSQTNPAYASGTPTTVSGTAANVLAVTGLTVGTNTSIEFTNGSVGLVQLEAALPNAGPTRFERRQIGQEVALCQRYFQKSYDPGTAPGSAPGSGNCTVNLNAPSGGAVGDFVLPVLMRAAPTVTLYDGAGTSGKVSYYGSSGWTAGGNPTAVVVHPARLFVQTNISGSVQVNFDYVVTAEL